MKSRKQRRKFSRFDAFESALETGRTRAYEPILYKGERNRERRRGGNTRERERERGGEGEKTIGEQRHPRAHFRFRAVVGGRKGGANSRDINSVLALGGLQGRKLRWLGGEPSPPASLILLPSLVSPPPLTYPSSSSSSSPLRGRSSVSRHPWLRFRRSTPPSPQTGGVTNQRLAIVNSTCAVKQLINKRLFTSCARSCFTRIIYTHGSADTASWRGKRKRLTAFFLLLTDRLRFLGNIYLIVVERFL